VKKTFNFEVEMQYAAATKCNKFIRTGRKDGVLVATG